MAWLARIGPESNYLTSVALPMMLLGIGQGISLSPMTVTAVAGVSPEDTGAASGIVNTAHQLGGSLGLALLVVVFSATAGHAADARADLAYRVAACLGVGAALLVVAFVVVMVYIVRRPAATAPAAPAAPAVRR